jgi:hypothetical protein
MKNISPARPKKTERVFENLRSIGVVLIINIWFTRAKIEINNMQCREKQAQAVFFRLPENENHR